jgi:hypothetical protein
LSATLLTGDMRQGDMQTLIPLFFAYFFYSNTKEGINSDG